MIQGKTYTLHIGNNLDILPTLPDNSVDSIVTDPPYELGFMGKKWDSSGIAYSVELWTQCLRVLKPGGHLLSFGGTRTWHRVAVAIEDAGFEVRDSIAWMYGSGFPKSLDVSKAIDKSDATEARRKRDLQFVEWMRTTGIKASEANEIVGKSDVASHYFRLDQPAVATAELFDKLRPYLPEVPDYIEKMVAERTIESQNFKNRQVLGQKQGTKSVDGAGHGIVPGGITEQVILDITAPATPEAQQWEGWGTALKPAFEPIVVARKPLGGKTVAENVLTYGTGGLNIDGSRIGTGEGVVTFDRTKRKEEGNTYDLGTVTGVKESGQGRWPANVILDEYTAELLDEQSDASRFFYVAKASKRDRNEGLEKLPEVQGGSMTGAEYREGKPSNQPMRQNFHPTVKPTDLMRYLIKLVTPPGAVVLDPFTGSGSTGKAAILEGFTFIGCELTEDYIPIIEGRLQHAEAMAAEAEAKKDEALF
jgi:DNA modification methylase